MYCKHCKKEIEPLVGTTKLKGDLYTTWYCSECKKRLADEKQPNEDLVKLHRELLSIFYG